MASGGLLRSVRSKASSEDRISQLSEDVKDRVLEFLDTREAARTSLISTQWRDLWLRQSRLVFDWGFKKLGTVRSTRMRKRFAEDAFTTSIQLLKECPNLLILRITLEEEPSAAHVRETISRMLEDPSGWLNDRDFCKLEDVDITSFTGSRQEMLLVKGILSNTPALERLVVKESEDFDDAQALNLSRDLLRFPRASPKAQVVFVDSKYSNTLDY